MDAFGSNSSDRKAVFIDGANLYGTSKALGFDIDYKRLLETLNRSGASIQPRYYTPMHEDQEYSSIRPLVDWLDYNGFQVCKKPVKVFHAPDGSRKFKGDCSVDITTDAMELAFMGRIDHMILFTGDGDFVPLVRAVQRRGVRVSVVSTIRTQPAMIADELRRQADHFIELQGLANLIGRDPADRPSRRDRFDDQDERSGMPAFLQRAPGARADESDYAEEAAADEAPEEPQVEVISTRPRAPGRTRTTRLMSQLPSTARGVSRS